MSGLATGCRPAHDPSHATTRRRRERRHNRQISRQWGQRSPRAAMPSGSARPLSHDGARGEATGQMTAPRRARVRRSPRRRTRGTTCRTSEPRAPLSLTSPRGSGGRRRPPPGRGADGPLLPVRTVAGPDAPPDGGSARDEEDAAAGASARQTAAGRHGRGGGRRPRATRANSRRRRPPDRPTTPVLRPHMPARRPVRCWPWLWNCMTARSIAWNWARRRSSFTPMSTSSPAILSSIRRSASL